MRARTEQAKRERREALLLAALDEFFERGFSAARMDDIAARAGFSKGTIYLYFNSKEDLFEVLVTTFASPNIVAIEKIMNSAPSFGDAMDGLATFAPNMIRESRLPKLMKVIIGDSQTFPDMVRRYRREILERLLAALAKMLQRAAQRGEIAVDDPALAARLIIAPVAVSGLWHALFSGDSDAAVDLETLFRMHVSSLKRGLSPGASS